MSQLTINFIDYLEENDKKKVEQYLPFLICEKCKELMLNPVFCSICQKTFCEKCSCDHKEELRRPRHLFQLLEDKLLIKCKYNCQEETFPLIQILEHIERCPYKSRFINKNCMIIDDICDNVIDTDVDKIIPYNTQLTNDLFLNKIINKIEDENNDEKNIKCYICNESFNNQTNFIKHLILCGSKETKVIQEIKPEEIEKKFECLCANLSNSHREKIKVLVSQNLNEIKENNLKLSFYSYPLLEKEKTLKSIKENLLDEEFINKELSSDPIYNSLFEKKKELFLQKEKLLKKYQEKNQEKKERITKTQNILIKNNKELIKNYLEKVSEYNWLDLVIKTFTPSINNGSCFLCKSINKDKYYCPICRKKYCKGKCAIKCKNKDCEKILCPQCCESCDLCGSKKYCINCQRLCFSELCNNKYCPVCIEKNKHQVKGPYDNCKIFKCKHEKIIETYCVMQTLYCNLCKKRMCYKCIEKDEEHKQYNIEL